MRETCCRSYCGESEAADESSDQGQYRNDGGWLEAGGPAHQLDDDDENEHGTEGRQGAQSRGWGEDRQRGRSRAGGAQGTSACRSHGGRRHGSDGWCGHVWNLGYLDGFGNRT